MMTCYDPTCQEPAQEELEEVQGIKIRVCTRGHRTAWLDEEVKSDTSIIQAA